MQQKMRVKCGVSVAWPGEPCPAYGFVLDEDAKAFFTAADSFAQLQVSEVSSQRVDFGRSGGRFSGRGIGFLASAGGGEVLGINATGGPSAWRALSRSARNCSFRLFARSAETPVRRWASRKAMYARSICLRSSAVGLGPAMSKLRSCMKS